MNAKQYIIRKVGKLTCELEPCGWKGEKIQVPNSLYVPSWHDFIRINPFNGFCYPIAPQLRDVIVWRIEDDNHYLLWGERAVEVETLRTAMWKEQNKQGKKWREWLAGELRVKDVDTFMERVAS